LARGLKGAVAPTRPSSWARPARCRTERAAARGGGGASRMVNFFLTLRIFCAAEPLRISLLARSRIPAQLFHFLTLRIL